MARRLRSLTLVILDFNEVPKRKLYMSQPYLRHSFFLGYHVVPNDFGVVPSVVPSKIWVVVPSVVPDFTKNVHFSLKSSGDFAKIHEIQEILKVWYQSRFLWYPAKILWYPDFGNVVAKKITMIYEIDS